MKKRLIHGFLSLVMLLSMAVVTMAAGTPAFQLDTSLSVVEENESFTAYVGITQNPGFEAIQVNVHYDSELVSCTSIAADKVLSQNGVMYDGNPNNNGAATFAAMSLSPVQGDGNLVELTFLGKKAGSCVVRIELVYLESNGTVISADSTQKTVVIEAQKNSSAPPQTDLPQDDPNAPSTPAIPPVTEPDTSVSFSDVPKTHWAYTYIQNAVANDLFSGIGNGQFGPGMNVTRGMFVTTLYSAAGSPDVELSDFADVPANAWYAKAVAWASQQGIVRGIGEGKFGPDMPITREQIALILFNYADGVSPGTEIFVQMSYPDAKDIHDWALTAFTWAMNKELITGKSGSVLDPLATATRAEVAVIMQNFVDLTK